MFDHKEKGIYGAMDGNLWKMGKLNSSLCLYRFNELVNWECLC